MNSTFKVALSTPMGVQEGSLILMDEGGTLSGSIRAMGNESPFRDGKMDGNKFEFSGVLRAGFLKFRYTARGTIEGNVLKGTASTGAGTFRISGTKLA